MNGRFLSGRRPNGLNPCFSIDSQKILFSKFDDYWADAYIRVTLSVFHGL